MKRLRIKLTAFNTLITGTILLYLTALCLGISEESGRAEAFQNFGTQLATAATYLQGQERVRMQWFSQLESAGNLHAAVTDGGYPLFSVGFDPERTGSAADMARVIAAREYGMPKGNQSFSCIFSMTAEDGTDYFAAVAKIPKGDSALELTLLRPLEDLEQRFVRQRLRVGLGAAVAVGLLGAFSWGFTGRVLRPVAESRQRQTRFIAAASHELRTPLTSILSAAAAMERAEGADRETFSQVIAREGRRMGRLIEDMLALASADSGGWQMHKRPVEPDMLLLECYETFAPQARERGAWAASASAGGVAENNGGPGQNQPGALHPYGQCFELYAVPRDRHAGVADRWQEAAHLCGGYRPRRAGRGEEADIPAVPPQRDGPHGPKPFRPWPEHCRRNCGCPSGKTLGGG